MVPIPKRMQHLPIDDKWKLPIPWFVATVDGQRHFPTADGRKWHEAIAHNKCWVCGNVIGDDELLAFVIGPMCGINRTSAEPPCHLQCAMYSAQACPFLSRPKMKRIDDNLDETNCAGVPLSRNPGCCGVWLTQTYKVFNAGNGPLIQIGEPRQVQWWCEGRPATRAEVQHSIDTGICTLQDMAKAESKAAEAELNRRMNAFRALLPRK